MPNGSDRITSHTLQELQTTKAIDDPEIKGWLALGIKKKKGGGKKKKGKKLERNFQSFTVSNAIHMLIKRIHFGVLQPRWLERKGRLQQKLSQWTQVVMLKNE